MTFDEHMQRSVIMIGAFPPPVHGMAVINQAMRQLLIAEGRSVTVVDISAPSLSRDSRYHLVRMARAARGLGRVLTSRHTARAGVYMSISGDLGQAYEVLYLLMARLKGTPVTLHHHSYAYLDQRRALTRLLVAAGPENTQHVVLSSGMAESLRRVYGVTRIRVLSNAAFLPEAEVSAVPERALSTLGFIGNVSREKGIFDFIELVDACHEAGLRVTGMIAGPFQDSATETDVLRLVHDRQALRYIGPQYGEAKAAFFRSIDVLVFPTRYANEAEPVTIHEALMYGVPVVAYGRGAIAEMLDGFDGTVVPRDDEFVPRALERIATWMSAGTRFVTTRRQAQERFRATRTQALASLRSLLASV